MVFSSVYSLGSFEEGAKVVAAKDSGRLERLGEVKRVKPLCHMRCSDNANPAV
jgi:hypothetical protein